MSEECIGCAKPVNGDSGIPFKTGYLCKECLGEDLLRAARREAALSEDNKFIRKAAIECIDKVTYSIPENYDECSRVACDMAENLLREIKRREEKHEAGK